MDLQIPPDEMSKLISGAILQMLTPEKREDMIKEALASLFDKQKSTSGFGNDRPSKLQEAFNGAAYEVARAVFKEELEKPEHRAKLAEIVTKAFYAAMVDESLVGRLTSVVAEVLSGRNR